MSQQYRYPGAKPFQTNESHVFYGRAGVSQDLYQLINLEPLVVLHAKSGLGKSSVINAGLMPLIATAKEYTPFNIRFHAYTEGKKEMPLSITRDIVQSQSDVLDKIRPVGEDSLWYHLKSQQLASPEDKGILLIFDQFEELFTYKDDIVEEFARQLSEALYSSLPQRFRDKRKAGFEKDANFLSPEELAQLDQALNLRLLMVIRSDRMSLMKKLKAYFPNILTADFELQPLEREQAEDAILSPAYQKLGFATPTFDYEDDAIEYLLDFLSENGKEPIESFQLQILCEYVEQHLVEKQGKTLIEKADIANPDQILENYYLDKIASITNSEEQLAARRLIEEGFIFEDEQRRLTLYEGQIFKDYEVNKSLLNQLLDTHLIRAESSPRGGYTYELSHDTLVVPILKAKAKRKDAEQWVRIQKELQARDIELLMLREKETAAKEQVYAEKQLRTKAELNEKRERQLTRLFKIVCIMTILLSGLAFWLRNVAIEEKNKAETAAIIAKNASLVLTIVKNNPTLALRIADYNIKKHPNNPVAITAFREVISSIENKYYKRIFTGHTAEVFSISFSPDGKSILTGSGDKTAILWDLEGNVLQNFTGHTAKVSSVSFSLDGKSILTGSFDKTAKLWDLEGNVLQTFKGPSFEISAVSFSSDGKNILTGSSDDTAKLWDLQGNVLQTFTGHTADIHTLSFSPDRKNILTGSVDKTAKLWDLQGNVLQTFVGHTSYVSAVSFSPDGKDILTGSFDNTVKLWGRQSNLLQTFAVHTSDILSASFSPDGKNILTGSGDNTAKLWDLEGNILQIFTSDTSNILAVSFSSDGKNILTGSGDKTAKLWDLEGNVLQIFTGHTANVNAVSFSPDGKSILTGSGDKTAKLWDLQGNVLQTFTRHTAKVSSVSFSPDGKSILTGSFDKTAKLWDLQGNVLQTLTGHTSLVYAVSFSPDGESILTGSSDDTARLWDLQGNVLQTFTGHTSNVETVSFSPDGENILTGSSDDTARLWDLQGNNLQVYGEHASNVETVSFSPDGKNVLTGSSDKTVKLWQTPQMLLDQETYDFTLQELYDAGTILTKEDLAKVKQKEK